MPGSNDDGNASDRSAPSGAVAAYSSMYRGIATPGPAEVASYVASPRRRTRMLDPLNVVNVDDVGPVCCSRRASAAAARAMKCSLRASCAPAARAGAGAHRRARFERDRGPRLAHRRAPGRLAATLGRSAPRACACAGCAVSARAQCTHQTPLTATLPRSLRAQLHVRSARAPAGGEGRRGSRGPESSPDPITRVRTRNSGAPPRVCAPGRSRSTPDTHRCRPQHAGREREPRSCVRGRAVLTARLASDRYRYSRSLLIAPVDQREGLRWTEGRRATSTAFPRRR